MQKLEGENIIILVKMKQMLSRNNIMEEVTHESHKVETNPEGIVVQKDMTYWHYNKPGHKKTKFKKQKYVQRHLRIKTIKESRKMQNNMLEQSSPLVMISSLSEMTIVLISHVKIAYRQSVFMHLIISLYMITSS